VDISVVADEDTNLRDRLVVGCGEKDAGMMFQMRKNKTSH